MSDYYHLVSVNEETSNLTVVKYGVLQGSVLGPLLFLFYMLFLEILLLETMELVSTAIEMILNYIFLLDQMKFLHLPSVSNDFINK